MHSPSVILVSSLLVFGAEATSTAQQPASRPAAPAVTATTAKAAPPPAAQPAAATPAASGAAAPEADDHQATLERLYGRIAEIEGRILAAQSRVNILRDSVISGGRAGNTKVIISQRNEMGPAFVLHKAVYTLDGEVLFDKEDPQGSLDNLKEFELFNGVLAPGDHDITVSEAFAGGTYGVFPYAQEYKYKVSSKWHFVVDEGRLTRISIVSFQKGDLSTPTSDKVAVRYDLDVGEPQSIDQGAAGGGSDTTKPAARPATPAAPAAPPGNATSPAPAPARGP